jgi:orotidine-5'-phosphate decarboxylase
VDELLSALQRVIWSADVPDRNAVMGQFELVPQLRRAKVDRAFKERNGNSEFQALFEALNDRGVELFFDAKYIEVPSKLEELAKDGVKYKPWMLNCMSGSLSNGNMSLQEDRDEMDGLMRFADVCLKAAVRPCSVTVLTSKSDAVVAEEFGRTPADQVLFYVEKLVKAKFTDVVCSPLEADAIFERFGDEIASNTPGVRFAGSGTDDQARVSTPGKAIEMHAACVIMGRPLIGDDPAALFQRAVDEITAALAA